MRKVTKQISVFTGLIYFNGKILLVQRSEPELQSAHGKWEFPGGKVKYNETPEQGLSREIAEETGHRVRPFYLLPHIHVSYWDYSNFYQQTLISCFVCRLLKSSHKVTVDHHVMAIRWFPLKEAVKLDLIPGIREFILAFIKLKKFNRFLFF